MSKRILVVEDQADTCQIIRDMLAPTGYEITEVENGEEALADRKTMARSQFPAMTAIAIAAVRLWHKGNMTSAVRHVRFGR